jgi:hypothetical protein
MYADRAAARRGASGRALTWPQDDIDALPEDSQAICDYVNAMITGVLELAPDRFPLLIGKSLGSYAAEVAVDWELPAIWFTPLLNAPEVVDALLAASAPVLLIGGTEDHVAWDGKLARQLTQHVHEVKGGDHGLFVPGPLALSARALGHTITAVEDFMDRVWPETRP